LKNKVIIEYLLWYLFFSFIIFATWEWIQTPFFVDVTQDINTIVWFRIHCTIGDIMILTISILVIGLLFRNITWFLKPSKAQLLSVTSISVFYTLFSEYRNVHISENWSYSSLMPKILGIGLIPVIQWILLPAIILYITSRFVNNKELKPII
jgi:hypothetical protein